MKILNSSNYQSSSNGEIFLQAHYEQGNLKEQKPTSNQLDSMMDTTEANDSTTYQPPHFQNLLFTFLDSQAPELSV